MLKKKDGTWADCKNDRRIKTPAVTEERGRREERGDGESRLLCSLLHYSSF